MDCLPRFQLPTCRWQDAQLHEESEKRAGGVAFSSLAGSKSLADLGLMKLPEASPGTNLMEEQPTRLALFLKCLESTDTL